MSDIACGQTRTPGLDDSGNLRIAHINGSAGSLTIRRKKGGLRSSFTVKWQHPRPKIVGEQAFECGDQQISALAGGQQVQPRPGFKERN